MAQFYASIKGNRGEATRMGSKQSGITGHIRGWDVGANVTCWTDKDGRDMVTVRITGGSNGNGISKCLGTFSREYLDNELAK
jgi:hypothetical protein